MNRIIIDTCVLIHIIRETEIGKRCLQAINDFDDNPDLIISVVTKAEMESFTLQNSWGQVKIDKLKKFLNAVTIVNIINNDTHLITEYSQIDGFSKGKGKDKHGKTLGTSAKKMGKNDLWIAATASALNIPLITSDGDFDHLDSTFIRLIKIS